MVVVAGESPGRETSPSDNPKRMLPHGAKATAGGAVFGAAGMRRNVCCSLGSEEVPVTQSCGNNSDATSSRDDSDSDCTCDVESSNHEDSGLFSADFNESIIAPPSPFVTRSSNGKISKSSSNCTGSNNSNCTSNSSSNSTSHNNSNGTSNFNSDSTGNNCNTNGTASNNNNATSNCSSNGTSVTSSNSTSNGNGTTSNVRNSSKAGYQPLQKNLHHHILNLNQAKKNKKGNDSARGADEEKPLHSTTIYIDGSSLDTSEGATTSGKKKSLPLPPDTQDPSIQKPQTETGESNTSSPVSHPAVSTPICKSCAKKDLPFFNPNCVSCWALLERDDATPSQVFAVLRLWIPEVQKCIGKLVQTALNLGCGVLDRDSVTDMTLLHYAVKAGSNGIGDPLSSLHVVGDLLQRGADLRQRCKWTSMTALHYAAFFDTPVVLELILKSSEGVSIDDPCLEYNSGGPLHIAAANLSEGAARVLLRNGASPWSKDSLGRTPLECMPSTDQFELVPDLQEIVGRIKRLFRHEWKASTLPTDEGKNATGNHSSAGAGGISGKAILRAVGLKLGDRVLVSGQKTAILRYAGPTEFATGLWAGVELESPSGKHNGTVKGVVYFRCAKAYGLFVPINRLTKIPSLSSQTSTGRERHRIRVPLLQKEEGRERASSTTRVQRRSLSLPPRRVNHGKVDVSKVGSKVAQDIRNTERKIAIGDKVSVDVGLGTSVSVYGVVRYIGGVHFASGYWIGIELDEARGSHDGSVCGTRYFTCRRHHGIFAASSRVTKLNGSADNTWPISYSTSTLHQRARSSSINSKLFSAQMSSSLTDSFSSTSSSSSMPFLYGEDDLVPLALLGNDHSQQTSKPAFYPTNTSMSNLNKCFSGRYISSRQRQDEIQRQKEEKEKEPQWQEPPPVFDVVIKNQRKKDNPHWLQIGHSVFYRNKVGVVRYIGRVHFGEGIWLGVELREKRGRHDGKIKGRRYFSCRNGHGVMVTPNKVTVHGLNGAKLVKPDEEEIQLHSSYNNLSVL